MGFRDKKYEIWIGRMGDVTTADIEAEELIYADMGSHHGTQCAYNGGEPEHEQIHLLCAQISKLVKQVEEIQNRSPHKIKTNEEYSQAK